MLEAKVATSSGIMAYYTLRAVQAPWITPSALSRTLLWSSTQTSSSASGSGVKGGRERPCPTQRLRKSLLLAYLCPRVIIGLLNILVDIGVPAEKEVIQ